MLRWLRRIRRGCVRRFRAVPCTAGRGTAAILQAPFVGASFAVIVSACYNGSHDLEKTVAKLNVEHYRKLLASEIDDVKRRTIHALLAAEEAKLAASEPSNEVRRSDDKA